MEIRIVSLENCYANIANKMAGDFFSQLISLRAGSYGPDYPKHYLPLDQSDFIATHHLFCFEEDGKLKAFGGLRQLNSSLLRSYKMPFPLLTSVSEAGASAHFTALKRMIEVAESAGREVLYSSRFVLEKTTRTNRELGKVFKEIIAGITYADFVRFKDPCFVAGSALRFKTQPFFEQLGLHPVPWEGNALEPFTHPISGETILFETILLMTMNKVSDWARECFEKYRSSIESRLIIAAEPQVAAALEHEVGKKVA